MATGSSPKKSRWILANRAGTKNTAHYTEGAKEECELCPFTGAPRTASKEVTSEKKTEGNDIDSVTDALRLLLPDKQRSTNAPMTSRFTIFRREREHVHKNQAKTNHDTSEVSESSQSSQPKEDAHGKASGKSKSRRPVSRSVSFSSEVSVQESQVSSQTTRLRLESGPRELKSLFRSSHDGSRETSTTPPSSRKTNFSGSEGRHSDDDEQLLEVLRHVVRKCTNPDPTRRLDSEDVYGMLKEHL